MGLSNELEPHLHEIGEKILSAKRDNPSHPKTSGWGQFLDVEDHREQIGPYGTCSAILFNHVVSPQAAVEENVVTQIKRFWDDPDDNRKLKSQNIRIAFLVISLVGAEDPELVRIRDEAIRTLIQRQRSGGAWGDWATTEESGPRRRETTAWILLALHMAEVDVAAIERAQDYLLHFVDRSHKRSAISDFAAAVLLESLDVGRAPPNLISRAKYVLKKFDGERSQRIEFFDFNDSGDGNAPPSLSRDYLCYPSIFTFALMSSGMTKHANFFTHLRAAGSRITLSRNLGEIIGTGTYYILPGAGRASTVDQAFISLAFQCLQRSEACLRRSGAFIDKTLAALQPTTPAVSFSFQIAIPILAAILAIIAIEDPMNLKWFIPELENNGQRRLDEFLSSNEAVIRVLAGAYLFFASNSPGQILANIRDRLIS